VGDWGDGDGCGDAGGDFVPCGSDDVGGECNEFAGGAYDRAARGCAEFGGCYCGRAAGLCPQIGEGGGCTGCSCIGKVSACSDGTHFGKGCRIRRALCYCGGRMASAAKRACDGATFTGWRTVVPCGCSRGTCDTTVP
jgi:hypothetical protein